MSSQIYQYQVAISYAREDSDYVSQVVSSLRDRTVNFFYDRSEEINLWGKDLYHELEQVYSGKALCCVMFLSKWYSAKVWTNYERRIIQSRALRENPDCTLPVRLDDTEIPGFPKSIVFIDCSKLPPSVLAAKIEEKVRTLELGRECSSMDGNKMIDGGNGEGTYRLVKVYEPFWFGGGAYASLIGGHRCRLAKITKGFEGINSFKGTACALMFDIEPRITLDWVRIDAIHVRVNSFQPLPSYNPVFPKPYEAAHVYYVEIDQQPGVYRADYYIENGKRDIGFVRLFRGRPESVIIRINARTPGIYNFDIELECFGRTERNVIIITKGEEFLFDW